MQSIRQYRAFRATDHATSAQGHGKTERDADVEAAANGTDHDSSKLEATKFHVDWDGPDDPLNPANFSTPRRIWATFILALLGIVLQAGASIDSGIAHAAAADLNVSLVVESLATAMYLIGLGVGCLACGPLSETFGRNPVYIGSLVFFIAWEIGAALSPNIGAQAAFRFLAGGFASPILTVAGGTIADLFNPVEKAWAFPLYAITGFGGPFIGPVLSCWIEDNGASWRWAEWIIVFMSTATLLVVALTQPETFAPILLKWKAQQLRRETGDERYRAAIEEIPSFWSRLLVSIKRPFFMSFGEIIIISFSLYLAVIYIVMFSFLQGYDFIFRDTYSLSQTTTQVIFIAIFVGILMTIPLYVLVYYKTKRDMQKSVDGKINPELRLLPAMAGAPVICGSLFWLGWTAQSSISIWSPILATVAFGFGVICIFITAYQYIIDSYGVYSASALTFVALVRYLAAGGMCMVAIPLFQNLGVAHTLTIMGSISAAMMPVPYLLWYYGPEIRRRSRFAE